MRSPFSGKFYKHPVLESDASVFYGASGYGMSCLRMYSLSKDAIWLDRAVAVGQKVLGMRHDDAEHGVYWPTPGGEVNVGYPLGASGIALFLLYLSNATGIRSYLDVGEEALAFDLSHTVEDEQGILGIARGSVDDFKDVSTHYWIEGTAGLLTTPAEILGSHPSTRIPRRSIPPSPRCVETVHGISRTFQRDGRPWKCAT